MNQTPAERTLAAEVRAVEDGHHARLQDPQGLRYTVKGHDHGALTYNVRVVAVGEVVTFTCDHLVQITGVGSAGATFVPCKHGARVAQRLEREGVLRWEAGRWLPTEQAYAAGQAARPVVVADVVALMHTFSPRVEF